VHPRQQGSRLKAQRPQGHQHQSVQLEAVTAATAANELGKEMARGQVDATPQLYIEVLERNAEELSRVQGLETRFVRSRDFRQANSR